MPADPSALFAGTADTARAPKVVYPNDGVLVPPNLGKLELHWLRGSADNALFEIVVYIELVDF